MPALAGKATKEVDDVETIPHASGEGPRGVQDGARTTAHRRAMVSDRRFIVTTMGLKPSPSGESFRFLIGR